MKAGWHEVTEERYYEMLGCLPPQIMTVLGFLVGEPSSHRTCSVYGEVAADYQPFARVGGRYYGASRCLTVREFKTVTPDDVQREAI